MAGSRKVGTCCVASVREEVFRILEINWYANTVGPASGAGVFGFGIVPSRYCCSRM